MVALERFRAGLERIHGETPHLDPFDGGVEARCLMLLETPGPRGSGIRFVSRDNHTGTARNIDRFCRGAGLDRRRMVLWNAVPWLIHHPGDRNRAPTRAEITDGIALVPALLALLPALQVVVLAGRVAALAEPVIAAHRPTITVLKTAHPSPVYVVTKPNIAGWIEATLAEAASLIRESSFKVGSG